LIYYIRERRESFGKGGEWRRVECLFHSLASNDAQIAPIYTVKQALPPASTLISLPPYCKDSTPPLDGASEMNRQCLHP